MGTPSRVTQRSRLKMEVERRGEKVNVSSEELRDVGVTTRSVLWSPTQADATHG